MNGAKRIAVERKRQIDVEKWTPEHDDEHGSAGLAWAATCYVAPELIFRQEFFANEIHFKDPWPWDSEYDKRPMKRLMYGNQVLPNVSLSIVARIRQLEKAGALIAAEIDRLLRIKP